MQPRESRGANPGARVDYICRDSARSGPIWLFNAGVERLRPVTLASAKSIFVATAMSRPDLTNTVLHLSFSPNPVIAAQRGGSQTRLDCMEVMIRTLRDLGLEDRVGVATFHRHPEDPDGVEHLHGVFALAHPESGASIPQHRIRERLRAAVARATHELGLSGHALNVLQERQAEGTPAARSQAPTQAMPEVTPANLPPRHRARRRSRGIER